MIIYLTHSSFPLACYSHFWVPDYKVLPTFSTSFTYLRFMGNIWIRPMTFDSNDDTGLSQTDNRMLLMTKLILSVTELQHDFVLMICWNRKCLCLYVALIQTCRPVCQHWDWMPQARGVISAKNCLNEDWRSVRADNGHKDVSVMYIILCSLTVQRRLKAPCISEVFTLLSLMSFT